MSHFYCYAEACHYAEGHNAVCRYAEWRGAISEMNVFVDIFAANFANVNTTLMLTHILQHVYFLIGQIQSYQ